MNIAIIGSGGREHALCQKIYESSVSKKIICIPGNAGTSEIAQNISLDISNFNEILNTIKFFKINLVIVGPEEPLVNGLVNFLKKNKIKVFGPTKYAAKLEGSKAFMKTLCKKYKIPTARYKICKNYKDVKAFLKKGKFPLVVKADGLAAGKGVSICNNEKAVFNISKEIFKGKFKSSKRIVLEEFIEGEEASYFLVVDEKNYLFFGTAQDHKKVGENDTGPNTGGMGAYSPALIINKDLERKILKRIVDPTLAALRQKGEPYTGFLYVGLMIKNGNPYLIEYNVRMGDPECQVILPRLKTDIIKIFNYAINNKINELKIKWKKEKCMTIVICSKGYPRKYKKNKIIKRLEKIKLFNKGYIFHAGTKYKDGNLLSDGGRVLNITSLGLNFFNIRSNILKIIQKINFKNGFYRKDIGWKVIK
tara:strand:+ start:178 stop:1440 length:1263 start_codon:yes stop_codon:yes gene_type:complete